MCGVLLVSAFRGNPVLWKLDVQEQVEKWTLGSARVGVTCLPCLVDTTSVDKPRLGDRRSGLKCWGLEVMEAIFGRQLTTGM